MLLRMMLWLAAFGLVAFPSPAQLQAQDAEPVLVMRVRSIDSLLDDLKYLAKLTGTEQEADQAVEQAKAQAGEKAFEAIDRKRPLGLYGAIGPNLQDSSIVLLLPITDEKAILKALEERNARFEKDNTGIYSLNLDNLPIPVPIFFRFANRYLYLSLPDKGFLEKERLLAPEKIFTGTASEMLSASFRIDQVPDVIKQILLGQLELRLTNLAEEQAEGETDAEHALKAEALKELSRQLAQLINEGGELSLKLELDQVRNEMAIDLSLTGQPGSKLAGQIGDLAKGQSLLAGIAQGRTALGVVTNTTLPKDMRQGFAKSQLAQIRETLAKEQNQELRQIGEILIKALEPTLLSGESDLAIALRGPNSAGQYTAVAGIKLKEGKGVEKAIKEIVAKLPENERGLFQFDLENVSSATIHRINFHQDPRYDEQLKKFLGENPIYVATRDDAVILSVGAEGLTALKAALAVVPQAAPPLQVNASLASLGAMTEKPEAAAKAAQDIFKQEGSDRIQFSVDGGKALKARLSMKTLVLKYLKALNDLNSN